MYVDWIDIVVRLDMELDSTHINPLPHIRITSLRHFRLQSDAVMPHTVSLTN